MLETINVRADILSGKYQVVFISPELMLTEVEMFRSDVYQENLVGIIHIIITLNILCTVVHVLGEQSFNLKSVHLFHMQQLTATATAKMR